ncbi:MAG: hypothetical protein ACWGMZ_08320 [Thermoguttaceae bacterium]
MKKNILLFYSWVVLLGIGFLAVTGCGQKGDKLVPVSGHVLIDGKPLEKGRISFIPEKGRKAYGKLGPGGKFTLTTFTPGDGCIMGKCGVTVMANERKDNGQVLWLAPKKYFQGAQIFVDITGPTDDLEIKLSWDGGKPFLETW